MIFPFKSQSLWKISQQAMFDYQSHLFFEHWFNPQLFHNNWPFSSISFFHSHSSPHVFHVRNDQSLPKKTHQTQHVKGQISKASRTPRTPWSPRALGVVDWATMDSKHCFSRAASVGDLGLISSMEISINNLTDISDWKYYEIFRLFRYFFEWYFFQLCAESIVDDVDASSTSMEK